MASTLYQSIFEKGEARGEARKSGDLLIRFLTRRLGTLDPAVATRIRAASVDTLDTWLDEAADLTDAESAQRLCDKIGKVAQS